MQPAVATLICIYKKPDYNFIGSAAEPLFLWRLSQSESFVRKQTQAGWAPTFPPRRICVSMQPHFVTSPPAPHTTKDRGNILAIQKAQNLPFLQPPVCPFWSQSFTVWPIHRDETLPARKFGANNGRR